MPMRSFRMSDELDARVEVHRGKTARSKWLLEAVQEKLSRSEVKELEADILKAAGMPEIRTGSGAGVGRTDAFRAAAARRQAALRQKP
jgi:hypothetical protein